MRLGRDDEAYAAFAKATWLDAWVAAGQPPAGADRRPSRPRRSWRCERAEAALRARPDQLQVRDLAVVLLRRLGRDAEAERSLAETLGARPAGRLGAASSPAGWTTQRGHTEAQTLLDVALENARVGELATPVGAGRAGPDRRCRRPLGQTACAVLADYHAACVLDRAR